MLTRRPNVFLVGGTGTGKTTLAQKLAAAHGFTHVSASEWFRRNFDGEGIADKQAFTDAITRFSREALALDPDLNVKYLRRRYPMDRGGHVVEGCRNPRDFEHLFDPRHDVAVVIHYPRNPVAATAFEGDGVRLIDGIAGYYASTGQLDRDRILRFTISSVSGAAYSCHSGTDPGPVVPGTAHAWNMDEVAASAIHAPALRCTADAAASGDVHCEVGPFAVQVAEQYLYDMDPAKVGGWVDCTAFAVSSYVGHAPTFQILLGNGAVFSYIPAQALRHGWAREPSELPLCGSDLVYHDCRTGPITATRYCALAAAPVRAFIRSRDVWLGARYETTVDWYEGNDLLHLLLLDNGQVAMLPSHKVLFGGSSAGVMPGYRKLHATFRVAA